MTGGSSGASSRTAPSGYASSPGSASLLAAQASAWSPPATNVDHVARETEVDDAFAVDRAERSAALVLERHEPHASTDASHR